MTDPDVTPWVVSPPLATGNVFNEGTMTVAPINNPQLDFAEMKGLVFGDMPIPKPPNISADGRSPKRECVLGRLKAVDAAWATDAHTRPSSTTT